MPEVSSLLLAKARAELFQDHVKAYVKRLPPTAYCLAVAKKVAEVAEDPDQLRYWPPHFVLHSAEVNCAFHRSKYSDPVTPEVLRRITNVYHGYQDPVVSHLLSDRQRVDLFLIGSARQQFFWQRRPGSWDFGRSLLVFDEKNFPKTSARMRADLGFGFQDWIGFCFALYASLNQLVEPIIDHSYFTGADVHLVDPAAVPSLFAALSSSPPDVGASYRDARDRMGVLYDLFIPSHFIAKPLVRYGSSSYICMSKDLVGLRGPDGIFDLSRNNWPDIFGQEFGRSFERYVESVLRSFGGYTLYTEKDMRRVTGEKMCDFILVGDSFVLFLECKAVEYHATLSTEAAIKGDNSTTKIGKAVDQLFSAAKLVRSQVLCDVLNAVEDKAFLAATITYRHIYFVNGDHYWQDAIVPAASSPEVVNWSAVFESRPQTLDIRELERLLLVSTEEGRPIADIWREKLSESELKVGEWSTFLNSRLNKDHPSFPLLEGVFERFTDSFIEKFPEA